MNYKLRQNINAIKCTVSIIFKGLLPHLIGVKKPYDNTTYFHSLKLDWELIKWVWYMAPKLFKKSPVATDSRRSL